MKRAESFLAFGEWLLSFLKEQRILVDEFLMKKGMSISDGASLSYQERIAISDEFRLLYADQLKELNKKYK